MGSWQAHLSELERGRAQCSRSSACLRSQVAVSQPLGDAAASSATCNPSPARMPWPIQMRFETIYGRRRSPYMNPGLQPWLGRTDEREGSQRKSDAKRDRASDLSHLGLDPPDLCTHH